MVSACWKIYTMQNYLLFPKLLSKEQCIFMKEFIPGKFLFHSAMACSKLTIEILELGVKYVQVNNKVKVLQLLTFSR